MYMYIFWQQCWTYPFIDLHCVIMYIYFCILFYDALHVMPNIVYDVFVTNLYFYLLTLYVLPNIISDVFSYTNVCFH